MKKIFTLMIAFLSMFATVVSAADVVFNVVVPYDATKPTTHMTYQVWIVGSFNGWNNNQKQLTKVDDTHYTITMDDATWDAGVTKENVQYKYICGGGTWDYVEKLANGEEKHANRVYVGTNTWVDANNSSITETSVGTNGNDTVVRWALTYNPNVTPIPMRVTIDAFVPTEVIQLYIVGNFNSWTLPTDSTKMTLVETTPEGKVFRVSFFSEDLNKLQYKFVAGPAWDYEQTQSANYQYPDVTQNTATESVTGFKAIYDPSKVGNINITATVPAGTQRVWIMGSHLGWNWANLQEGTKNADGTFSFVAQNVMSVSYRLYNWTEAWAYPEADDADATKERAARTAAFPADANLAITVSAWRNEAPNGLKGLDADKYRVYTNNNSIVVEGVTSKAELFDISGRNLQTVNAAGTYTSQSLNKGLYIIRIDGATMKVAVK